MSWKQELAEQERVFSILYDRALGFLRRLGNNSLDGDFWIVDDNYGPKQHKIYFYSYRMLAPGVIRGLQVLLEDHSDWDWVIVALPHGAPECWPEMGLIVRKHEIIDGLKREYFPKEYQSLRYEGARPGTDRD